MSDEGISKRDINSFWKSVREEAIKALDMVIAQQRLDANEHQNNWASMHEGDEETAGVCPLGAADRLIPRKNTDMKMVLMMLGNNLVTEHRFEPGKSSLAYSGAKNTSAITALTIFINENPEARQVLEEMGLEWSMPNAGNQHTNAH